MGLVITRKLHESVRIGDGITVEIGKIAGDKVRLNITAPPNVKIIRTEIIDTGRDVSKNLLDKDVTHGDDCERRRFPARGPEATTDRLFQADHGDELGEFCDE